MADFDSPWKEALDFFFEAFLELFFSQAYAEIDWTRGWQSLDKELQQVAIEAEIGRRYVDKLVKVWLKTGEEQWVLIHVEVQMSEDSSFTWRMYVYNYRVFDKYNKEVASFAVLGDDNPNWRPAGYAYRRWGTEAGLRFPIVKLLDYAARRPELEASENPFATVVLAHLDTQETRENAGQRKDRKFLLVKGLLDRGWDARRVRQLFRVIDWLMELPKDLKIEFHEQLVQHEEEKRMPFVDALEEIAIERERLKMIETILDAKFPAAPINLCPRFGEFTILTN